MTIKTSFHIDCGFSAAILRKLLDLTIVPSSYMFICICFTFWYSNIGLKENFESLVGKGQQRALKINQLFYLNIILAESISPRKDTT